MTVWSGVGAPGATISGGSGAQISAFNNIGEAAPRVVAPVNPQRLSITFYNPSPTAKLYIAPTTIQNVMGAVASGNNPSIALAPTNAALAGCIPLFPEGYLTFVGQCQGAFQAFAFTGSGSANPLTVIESNV